MNIRTLMEELFAWCGDGIPHDYSNSCDTLKTGNPETEVSKVAVSMFATPDLIREVQANYHLPGKARTVGEMLADELLRLFGQFADADRTIVVGTDGRGAEGEHCGGENQKLFHGVSFF